MILSVNFLNNKIPSLPPFRRGGVRDFILQKECRRDLRIPPFPPLEKGGWVDLRRSFLHKTALLLVVAFFFLPGVMNAEEARGKTSAPAKKGTRIAVYPVENLSGIVAPVKEIRQIFIGKLRDQGVDVVEEEVLEKLMAKYRIRYTGGINREIAKALRQEIDTDGVLIITLEFYSDANPPKISLISRLVSTGENPAIIWMDGVGLAGDDSPGILSLGLIEDPKLLLDKGIRMMVGSLLRSLSKKGEDKIIYGAKKKFQPKISFRSPALDPDRKYTVAIVPFFNISVRKYVGEIVVLHFAGELNRFKNFDVIELGVVRQALLELRIIMDQGISLVNADSVAGMLDADLMLAGEVADYEDYQGVWGKPKVSFSAQLIERKSREVVWSSHSYNEGDDGVFFFDLGRVNTASAMASQMVRSIGEQVAKEKEE